ncbi:MAG: MFS transporter [Dehalococcoidia bacterium]
MSTREDRRVLRRLTGRFGVALEYPDFRRLWMANAFAQAGSWGLIVTRGWFIYSESESPFLVGLATFAAMGPMLIIPPVIGVLADRLDRRRILSAAYIVDATQSAMLMVLAFTGLLEVWMVIGLSLVNGISRSTQLPTSQAMAATLVPGDRLLNALALNASTQHGSRLFGPGIVTPLLAVAGAPAAFLVSVLFYVGALVQIRRLPPQPPTAAVRHGFVSEFLGGLAFVYERPVLRMMLLILVCHCALTMAFESLLPSFAAERLQSPEGFGALMMGVGSGALVASLWVSGLQTTRARGNALLVAGLISGLGQVLLALTTSLVVAVAAAAVMGGAQAAFMTMGQAVTQSIATDEFRGRVASLNAFSLGGMMATMNLFNGTLAEQFGAQPILLIDGVLFALIVLLSLGTVTGRRVYDRRPAAAPVAA